MPQQTPTVLEPQPTDAAQTSAWLERLRAAAEAALPDGFTLQVSFCGQTLDVPFDLRAPDWDPDERRYSLARPLTYAPGRDQAPITLDAGAITFTGHWLAVRGLRGRRHDELADLIRNARRDLPSATRAIVVCELHRVIRLRLRVGETDIQSGGHDADVATLQRELATLLP